MSLATIVSEPNCLSHFVQYLDSKNALPLIKFYLDTENFKKAALAQIRKERRNHLQTTTTLLAKNAIEGIAEEELQEPAQNQKTEQLHNAKHFDDAILKKSQRGAADGKEDDKQLPAKKQLPIAADSDNKNVPELKTLCDLSMRKPLTDDEKSKIYAETNKQLTKSCNTAAVSTESLSACSLNSSTTMCTDNTEANTSMSNNTISVTISLVSVRDALTIYQKYLSSNSGQFIDLPIELLAKISLVLCKTNEDELNAALADQTLATNEGLEDEDDASMTCTTEAAGCITTDCFCEAQQYILQKLEKDFLNDFLQSTYYAKYCIELIETSNLNIRDILYSEVTLFYLMEYLEQHQERDCLEFWSTAINYRKTFTGTTAGLVGADSTTASPQSNIENCHIKRKEAAQSDAMIVYEKFFSLQSETKLWSSNKLRSHVESCICSDDMIFHCFDLPLRVAAKYLERKYLKGFLKSALFSNYINELKTRIEQEDDIGKDIKEIEPNLGFNAPLRKCIKAEKAIKNRHRKTLSDCTLDRKLTISQHNTLLASMDHNSTQAQSQHKQATSSSSSSTNSTNLKQFHMNIDSLQLTNPNLLWQRNNSNNLKFGRINSLGRYERDFMAPSDVAAQQSFLKTSLNNLSSLTLGGGSSASAGHKFKNAMRKLINLPEDNLQEEIAWQVAEMIVKDVTSVTMGNGSVAASPVEVPKLSTTKQQL